MQKLNDIQDSYNKAADVERQSGEGILDEDEERTFHDKLFRICKHWDVLYPVFHDRASAKPIAPTGTCKPPVRSAIDTRSGVEDSNGHRDLTSRLVSLPQVPAKAVMRRVTITTVTRLTLSQIRVRLMWLVDLMTASMLLQTTVL
ncbi:hypothetical protein, variant 1 [Phytophthora nicotianae INRA-310]|uniref:Uncharacterized protein n=1 Tax=Phytophthora nicotianae (strain INRA-310) TaxID=761204 RepID=W2QVB2_PHYN3|nr:hypothetical protein, variant 2 [Phytophthora nicotianae INRA-310]XP_008898554.1 hypothetical protein, variant 1 [Phytophthora nicotianae INRA-310]ETN16200.1 hypothetical protein, variant 1 [Phytophthora nicotianae INRA-310]ETN16201.1 hypothetical protein, variant 2 [Phytophthora nicotianae INRA-310]